jgi:release factor glutamine methyltransferase
MTASGTIKDEIAHAMGVLADTGVDTPQLDAEVLMTYIHRASRVHVISHPEELLSHDEVHRYREMVERRAKREPLAYITGEKEFWGLTFEIAPGVLVPRPETEALVESAIAQLRRTQNPLIADIGIGSGCVAIALAVELPDAVVYGTEVSSKAIEIARKNALRHQVQIRVDILEGDLLDPLPKEVHGRLDAIVSNPPYIPSTEIPTLQPEIKDYEPIGALDGGPDGMIYHRRILDATKEWLKSGGWVHMEVGIGQAEHVLSYAREHGYADTRIANDLAKIPRIVSAQL